MQTPSLSLQGYSASTLVCTVVKPSRGISARNPQAFDLRPAPRLPTGNVHGVVDVRPKHVGMKIKQRQADTIGSRALCVPPHGCCVLPAPRFQVHSHRCPLAGRKMHTHWLHVLPVPADQAEAYRCKHAGAHRPGSRCTGARRPGSGHTGARRPGSRCSHAGTRRPGSRCKLAGAYLW